MLAGQEIGMANLGENYGPEAYIDVEGRNYYEAVLKTRGGDHTKMGDVMRELQLKARDHGRLPMQWDDSANAGFSGEGTQPWMTINRDYVDWNVSNQIDDSNSVLAYWRRMLSLRKDYSDIFTYGSYTPLSEGDTGEKVLGYERQCHETGKTAVVLLNFSDREQKVQIKSFAQREFEVLVSNQEPNIKAHNVTLMPHGAIIKASYVTLMPYGAVVLVDRI